MAKWFKQSSFRIIEIFRGIFSNFTLKWKRDSSEFSFRSRSFFSHSVHLMLTIPTRANWTDNESFCKCTAIITSLFYCTHVYRIFANDTSIIDRATCINLNEKSIQITDFFIHVFYGYTWSKTNFSRIVAVLMEHVKITYKVRLKKSYRLSMYVRSKKKSSNYYGVNGEHKFSFIYSFLLSPSTIVQNYIKLLLLLLFWSSLSV